MDTSRKITELNKFIKDNHSWVEGYYSCYYERYKVTSESKKEQDWKEQLRILFVNVLNAGGEGKLSEKAETIRKFEGHVNRMQSPTYEELLKAFDVYDYQGLFEKLKDFKQIGPKKSALFLRDILFFNKVIPDVQIIDNIPEGLEKELLVPVDVVITRTLNSIFDWNYTPSQFDEINSRAREIFPEKPIWLEDLWFWGRFYRCIENKKNPKIPYCAFNKDLLIVDINVTREYREKLMAFSERQAECPFKKICSKCEFSHI